MLLFLVAVAFFFGAMSTLEGKPHEAYERIQEVCPPLKFRGQNVNLFPHITTTELCTHFGSQLVRLNGVLNKR